jgi:hypothetical protein
MTPGFGSFAACSSTHLRASAKLKIFVAGIAKIVIARVQHGFSRAIAAIDKRL